MNTATMRRIDRWLGGPMCMILTAYRRVTSPLRAAPPATPQRIVVVKLAEQGAWVVAYGALRRATELVGRENVFLMTFDENRFVIDQLDLVPASNVIEVRTNNTLHVVIDLLRAVRRARRERIDAALDFEFFARSSTILCFLSGASRRVGFHPTGGEASYRGDLLTHRLAFNSRLHVSETFQLIVEALSVDPSVLPALDLATPRPELPPLTVVTPSELDEVSALVQSQLVGADPLPPLILLNANAGDLLPLRRWPADRYVTLAHRLLEHDPRLVVVFTGGPSEAGESARLAAQVASPRCVSMGGRTSLRQLVVLYSLAEVLVTNDSGPAHYAALAPIDIVTLFGPESPKVFGSLSPRHRALWAELPCSPCVNAYNDRTTRCRDNLCMQHISVDEVFTATIEAYERRCAAAS